MRNQTRVSLKNTFCIPPRMRLNASASGCLFTSSATTTADSADGQIIQLKAQAVMRKHTLQTKSVARLVQETASASMEVIASRMLTLADPREFGSRKQMRDLSGMVSEKIEAGAQGWMAAAMELGMMPYRLASSFASPSSLTASGVAKALADAGSLWLGVGVAAASPARSKVVANRSKLRKRRAKRQPLM